MKKIAKKQNVKREEVKEETTEQLFAPGVEDAKLRIIKAMTKKTTEPQIENEVVSENTNNEEEVMENKNEEAVVEIPTKRKYTRKVVSNEVELVNTWAKEFRKNVLEFARSISDSENKKAYLEKIHQTFNTANENISQMMNEVQFVHQIKNMSPEQLAFLKKMLNN